MTKHNVNKKNSEFYPAGFYFSNKDDYIPGDL